MKKTKLFAVVLVLMTLVSVLASCTSERKPQDADGFSKVMENNGFEVHDVSLGLDPTITSQIFALKEEYQVEYYKFTDNEVCRETFDKIKEEMNDNNPVKTLSTDIDMDNYGYFDFNAGENYFIMARVENTLIYCTANKDNRNDIIGIFKTLGYT